MKAFAVSNKFWPGSHVVAYYSAENRSQAKGRAARTLQDVSSLSDRDIFAGMRAVRAPEFDGLQLDGVDLSTARRDIDSKTGGNA